LVSRFYDGSQRRNVTGGRIRRRGQGRRAGAGRAAWWRGSESLPGLIAGVLDGLPLPHAAALGCAADALETGALGRTGASRV
jgi:hypothetical protein